MTEPRKPGLDTFWEVADQDESGQDPLERELDERVDALTRYRSLIADAEANGREGAVEVLMKQHDREEAVVKRLREALERRRRRRGESPG